MTDAPSWWRNGITQQMAAPAAERHAYLLTLVPTMLWWWMALLVVAGRSLAARIATLMGWPSLSRASFPGLRLPDGALVPLLVGLALVLFAGPTWHPSGWILLVSVALGYSLQGLAVVSAMLQSRGMPHGLVALVVVCVVVVSLFWILPALAVLGLTDVWLDHRRLEPSPHGEA